MPRLLEETELDPQELELDEVLTDDEESAVEAQAMAPLTMEGVVTPDLSDGGRIGRVKVTPTEQGKKVERGRPNARKAWSWNGTETTLLLAWNPDGTIHDAGRHYLRKRHCICCRNSGFTGRQCPTCVKGNCARCRGSTDVTTEQKLGNGQKVKGWIISNFYLKQELVPYPALFYGTVDCFLPFCPRSGAYGFITEQEMRLHARTRHKLQYESHLETLQAKKVDDVELLREEIRDLRNRPVAATASRPRRNSKPKRDRTPEQIQADKDRMAHARAGRQ